MCRGMHLSGIVVKKSHSVECFVLRDRDHLGWVVIKADIETPSHLSILVVQVVHVPPQELVLMSQAVEAVRADACAIPSVTLRDCAADYALW